MSFPIPANESDRLRALHEYRILDTPPEECYDEVVLMIQRILSVPIAMLSFVAEERQWFKACVGVEPYQTAREHSICTHAIVKDTPFVVEDTLQDERFRTNPYVVGPPHVRFYAGIPLMTPNGEAVGSLCAVDSRPRRIGPRELDLMKSVARLVVRFLELRKASEETFHFHPTLPESVKRFVARES